MSDGRRAPGLRSLCRLGTPKIAQVSNLAFLTVIARPLPIAFLLPALTRNAGCRRAAAPALCGVCAIPVVIHSGRRRAYEVVIYSPVWGDGTDN